ncbi:hypothetical protein OIU76_023464 [Salix suchowensis]|nr:hypothetical protein OIU76_023464 [Salix suchowensis]
MNTTTLVHDTIAKEFGRILKGYQPLDRYGAPPDNDPREMGHRSARAKQRQVFLKVLQVSFRNRVEKKKIKIVEAEEGGG